MGSNSDINAAETYVARADAELEKESPSYMIISAELHDAVTAYQQIKGQQERRDELYARLREAQPRIGEEMSPHSFTLDISESVENAMKHVEEQELRIALLRFATMIKPISCTEMESMLEKSENTFIHELVPCVHYNDRAHVIDRSSIDDSLETRMHRQAQTYQIRKYHVDAAIAPALFQIRQEHYMSLNDWAKLIINHPFVPQERIHAFALGLFHGFHGDFFSAAHILIPQIEHSIRYILETQGTETSQMNQNGTQEERSLNQTLDCEELKALLPADIIFDLQGLLIRKEGVNLRNNLMHGLLDDGYMYSEDLIYLYWLTIHFLFTPVMHSRPDSEN